MRAGYSASITRCYVSVPAPAGAGRMVHYRVTGSGPNIVLLHDSPRSSRLHVPLMKMLASRFRVFALDTPGYGNSDPLDIEAPTVPDFAEALGTALDALGLSDAPVYATHTSAKIALALAVRGGRMPMLLLDGLSIPDQPADDAFIAAYMRPFAPEPTGAWLAAEWSRTRDMLRWFPWFSCTPDRRIAAEPPSAEWLEDYGIDLFSAGPHYADAYTAAMRWNPIGDLLAVRVPTIVGAREDDVLFLHLAKVPCDRNPALSVQRLGTDREAWIEWISETLARARTADEGTVPPHDRSDDTRGYLALDHGQLHWSRYASASTDARRPMLILSAPSTLEAHQWAHAFAPIRPVIVPDLPGFGDSDPLPPDGATADALADALAALIDTLESNACDVMSIGLAAPIGARIAARWPDRVASLAIWGAPTFGGVDVALTPDIAFDPLAGSHLHRFWHMLRDGCVQWPWHDARPEAARAGEIADPDELHRALTGMLKQRINYGQAIAAAMAANQPSDWQGVKVPVLIAMGDDPSMASATSLLALLPDATAFRVPQDHAIAAAALDQALAMASGPAQAEAIS
ncbi:alpha/beta fold hydrolase [Rhizorhabdus sp. FW153]|uniref:alpha/beta fold hydrolase n=1 Tax=Rhizorhabdus sp. FW153 TaxID=3400216 RepID=UPI003CF720A0